MDQSTPELHSDKPRHGNHDPRCTPEPLQRPEVVVPLLIFSGRKFDAPLEVPLDSTQNAAAFVADGIVQSRAGPRVRGHASDGPQGGLLRFLELFENHEEVLLLVGEGLPEGFGPQVLAVELVQLLSNVIIIIISDGLVVILIKLVEGNNKL